MYKRRCAWCKKVMQFKAGEHIKMFCSKQCYSLDREKRFASEDSGPPMKPLTAKDITDEGYHAIVEAMVSRAADDVKQLSPGTQYRVSAEKFFESDYFTALTGLDGQAVLRDLRDWKKKKKPETRKKKHRARAVRCIETGAVYNSVTEAAGAYNIYPSNIVDVCRKKQKVAAGLHWEYMED